MKAFLYVGGKIHPEYIHEAPKGDDLIIAADSGYRNAEKMQVVPNILVGDFDSLGGNPPHDLPPTVEVIRLPCEKDLTDTQIAVQLALEKGAEEIVLIGGLGGRLDHTLSTLALLEDLAEKHIVTVITDGQSRARFFRSTSYLIARTDYRYLSLIAADDIVKGVSVEGCKYPLKNARLSRRLQYAISNEITGNCALISVKKGGVYLIESRDL